MVPRGKGKVQISDNVIKLCDIGIQALDQSTPIIRYKKEKENFFFTFFDGV